LPSRIHPDTFLALTLITYTAFIIVMFITVKTGSWLRNDPKWFASDTTFTTKTYKIGDPSN
jgi:hypothetical protein